MSVRISASGLKRGLILTRNLIVKQSPIILTVAAVGGVVTTTLLAVKATTEAQKLIEKKKIEDGIRIDEKLTAAETVQTAWKPFVPVVISAGLTIGAIVGSSAINEKRKAALAGLYALSETALQEYQAKTEEMAGPAVLQKIKDEVNGDKVPETFSFIQTELEGGDCPVLDLMSGRIFISSVEKIRRAANDINEGIDNGDMCASLNDFYDLLPGIEPNELGVECGWNLTHHCHPYFTSRLTSNGRPILVLDWRQDGRPISTYRDI